MARALLERLRRIVDVGTAPPTPEEWREGVGLANRCAALCTVVAAIVGSVLTLRGQPLLGGVILSFIAGLLLTLALARAGRYRWSTTWIVIWLNFAVFTLHLLVGPGVFEFGHVVVIGLPFMVFERGGTRRPYLFAALGVAVLVLDTLLLDAITPFAIPPVTFAPELAWLVRAVLRVAVVIVMTLIIGHFYVSRGRAIENLGDALTAARAASEAKSQFLANTSQSVHTRRCERSCWRPRRLAAPTREIDPDSIKRWSSSPRASGRARGRSADFNMSM